jgi:beta-glucosidase
MSAFNDLNGIPASASELTLRTILKNEWGFRGFVVSDWESLTEMLAHGFCEDDRQAALEGARAGVDMEMVSRTYSTHLPGLIAEGKIRPESVDASVRAILRVKFALGLFDDPHRSSGRQGVLVTDAHRAVARAVARQSLVLLKNDKGALPLARGISRLAVIGPLADAPREQLGCWIPDGSEADSITPLAALREALSGTEIRFAPGLPAASSRDTRGLDDAVHAARGADATLLFLGEEAFLSGEAHSRAFIDLPGAQESLLRAVADAGRPLIVVVLAGRPLVLGDVIERADAVIYAWHPGTMAGPAIADVLLGDESPSGRLPASLPRAVGQIPVYYAHKNTGRPPAPGAKGVPTGTPLDPSDFSARHLDVETAPLLAFGFGGSYTRFSYANLRLSSARVPIGSSFQATVEVTNSGPVRGGEVVQLYVRDLVGNVTRPVKELKGFQRIELEPGATRAVTFTLKSSDLAFWGRDMTFAEERGRFHLWIGPNSTEGLRADFELV